MRASFGWNRNWNPLRELSQLQREFSRVVNGLGHPFANVSAEYPPVNLHASENALLLTAEIPGLDPQKLDINVTRESVTLKGERPAEDLGAQETYHRRERGSGAFSRTVTLPCEVDPSAAEATYERGVLKVRLSRPEEQKPQKVSVKVT